MRDAGSMTITFFPATSREAVLLGEVRALEARVAALEADNARLCMEGAVVRDQNAFLLDEVFQWKAERARLRGEIARLEVQVRDLERRLGRNSSNSSMPPASDPARRRRRKRRGHSVRRRGAQPGHAGASRQEFGPADRTQDLHAEDCDQCGRSLDDQPAVPGRYHQVAEWVERPIEVVEYHHEVKCCPDCRRRVEAPYPPDVIPGCRFGPRLIAIWGLFNRWGFTSIEKLTYMFNEDFGVAVSQGGIANGLMRLREALRVPYDELARSLRHQPLLHIDETGWHIAGVEHYVWTFATEQFGYFTITRPRSRAVVISLIGTSGEFGGAIVSDFYDVYDGYRGQRCLAHLLRDLEAVEEEPDVECQVFARALIGYLKDGYALWRQYCRGPEHFTNLRDDAEKLRQGCKGFLTGLPEHVPDPIRVLRNRFQNYWDEIWYFLDHPGVPPDNSLAERSIRPIVTFRKMSGGSQSNRGAELTAMIHTVLDTCKKQGRNPLDFMVAALLAHAQPTKHAAPSLLPPRPG